MATEVTYRADFAGDWGIPPSETAGAYSTDTLSLPDGTQLFFRSWRAADPQAPVLVLLHGLGAHSGWFIDFGNAQHARGLTVYANDHRGFGRSGGARGHVAAWKTYVRDTDVYLDEVRRRHPGAPISLMGHSMGGVFALYTAADDARSGRKRLASLILLNPWIKDTSKTGLGTQLGILLGGLRGSSRAWRVAGGPETMTENAEAARMVDADSYWVRAQTSAFLYQVALKMRGGALRQARDVRAPALVIQSERDVAVVPAATRRCYEALGSAEKRWQTYPAYAHDAEFEADRAALDDDIAQWVAAHRQG